MADSTAHQNVMEAFYEHIVQMVTFTPKGAKASAAFHPDTTLVQLDTDGSINPDDYKNMYSPSTGSTGSPEASENFFLLTDIVGGLGPTYIPSTTSVSAAYKVAVESATSDSTTPAGELQKYNDARKKLYTNVDPKDPKSRVIPTPAYNIYLESQTAYVNELSKFTTAQINKDLSQQGMDDWREHSRLLQMNVDNAYNAWQSAGDVVDIQNALDTEQSIGRNVDSVIISDAKETLLNGVQESNVPGGSPWYVTLTRPSNWWQVSSPSSKDDSSSNGFGSDSSGSDGGSFGGGSGGFDGDSGGFDGDSGGFGGSSDSGQSSSTKPPGWMSYSLNSNSAKSSTSSYYTKSHDSGWVVPVFFAWGGADDDDKHTTDTSSSSENLTIKCELLTVTLERPWLNDLLFKANNWHMNGEKAGWISKADSLDPVKSKAANAVLNVPGQATELLPIIPTAFVLARNVTIKGNWSDSDKKTLHDVNTSTAATWSVGPFFVHPGGKTTTTSDTSSSTSSFDGETLSIPDMQIVAWINEVVHFSPPKDSP